MMRSSSIPSNFRVVNGELWQWDSIGLSLRGDDRRYSWRASSAARAKGTRMVLVVDEQDRVLGARFAGAERCFYADMDLIESPDLILN